MPWCNRGGWFPSLFRAALRIEERLLGLVEILISPDSFEIM